MANYSSAMDSALSLINKQYSNVSGYYDEATTAFETQFSDYSGNTMKDAINAIAGSGIYESPVSEMGLNRKRASLAETYATGKSQLAGEKLSALGSIDSQRIGYYQNLATLQNANAMNKAASNAAMWGTAATVAAVLV